MTSAGGYKAVRNPRRRRTPLLVLDKPDALGETWCWRFATAAWTVAAVLVVGLALVGVR